MEINEEDIITLIKEDKQQRFSFIDLESIVFACMERIPQHSGYLSLRAHLIAELLRYYIDSQELEEVSNVIKTIQHNKS